MKYINTTFLKDVNDCYDFVLNKGLNTINIVWILIGCAISKDELETRHEYPPIIEQIYKHCPHLENKISYHELSSPLSTRDMAHYEFGELYGTDHTPDRFRQKWLRPKTPIKGLFLTGQDITTVGLPSALAGTSLHSFL